MQEQSTYAELENRIKELESIGSELIGKLDVSQKNEAHFRSMFKNVPVGHQSLDEKGCILDVNQIWLDSLDYKREEVIGSWFGDFLFEKDREGFRNNFPQNIIAAKKIQGVELRLRRKDSSYIVAEYTSRAEWDDEGSFSHTNCTFQDVTIEKDVEQALFKSEKKYRELVENIKDVLYEVDQHGVFTYISERSQSLLGYSPKEIVNTHFQKYLHPDDRQRVLALFQNNITGNQTPVDCRARKKDGVFCWISVSNSLIHKGQAVIGIRGVLSDISEKVSAQIALEEKTNTVNNILHQTAEGICVCHNISSFPFVSFTHWNPQMVMLTGYSKEEINTLGWYQTLYPDENIRRQAMARMETMRLGDNIRDEEWTITSKKGEQRVLSISTTVMSVEGKKTSVLASMTDITRRKQQQAQLQQSKKEWQDIFQAIGNPAIILDRKHNILKANKSALQLIGVSEEQLTRCKCYNVFHDSDSPPATCPMKKLLSQNSFDKAEVEMNLLGATFLVTCTPIADQHGHLDKVIHVLTDVTKVKELEAQIRHGQKLEAIGTLSGGIAHEFNNMLSIIMGNAEIAASELPKGSPTLSCVDEIKTTSLRARDVVKKLMSAARKSPEKEVFVNIRTIVEESLSLLRSTTPSTVDIVTELKCTTETILADPTEMTQILMNLCINSIQSMKDKPGKLKISLESHTISTPLSTMFEKIPPGTYARLEVTDTGDGIPSENLERVFDPYFTTKDVDEGLGMGMAIVLGIVKKRGGAVDLKSETGVGTTIELFFPIVTHHKEKKLNPPRP